MMLPRPSERMVRWWVGVVLLLTAPPIFGFGADPLTPQRIRQEFALLSARLRQTPNDVTVLNSLGILYARAGQLNDAILLWNRALTINPRYIHLYNNLGSALKAQGRVEEAVRVYQAGLAITPSFWIYYNLGLLEKDRGRYREAAHYFRECLRQNPRFEAAAQRLEDLGYVLASQQAAQGIPYKPPTDLEALSLTMLERLEGEEGAGEGAESRLAGAPSDTRRPWRAGGGADLPVTMTVETCAAYLEKMAQGAPTRLVALTFDDGPHPSITPRLLDLLQAHGAKGTFFVLGSRAESYPELLERMVREGHEVGNHSWSHKSLVRLGPLAARADLQRAAATIEACTNQPCRLVRPPYGHTNAEIRAMIHRSGWAHIMWDADSRDWQLSDANQILARTLRKTSPGAVLLFHDIHPGVLRVLPVLLPALRQCGYRFVTVSELLRLQGSRS